ncbi:MAG: sensor histidine kinase [bacterium]
MQKAILLLLIRLQSREITSKKLALDAFKKTRERIRSMSLIHNKLYQSKDFSHINMKDYIESIVSELCNAYGVRKQIRFNIQIRNVFLDINQSIPCGLIINEILTNTFKYAFPNDKKGTVRIYFSPVNDSTYKLIIKDDGKGLPDNVDMNKSLGFRIINTLVEQIDAELQIKNENGTCFTMILHKNKS